MVDIIPINGTYISTSTSILYIPLVGSILETTNPESSDVVIASKDRATRLVQLTIESSTAMVSAVISIYSSGAGAIIGTKNVSLFGPELRTEIFFDNMMDTGINGASDGFLSIGVTANTAGDIINFSAIFLRNKA